MSWNCRRQQNSRDVVSSQDECELVVVPGLNSRGAFHLGRLSLTATFGSCVSSTSAHPKAASASVTLETATALTACTVPATTAGSPSARSEVGIGSVCISSSPALFNINLFRPDLVRVGRNGCGVTGWLGKFNEGTILHSR